MMENWKDYVGYQPVSDNNGAVYIGTSTVDPVDKSKVNFSIWKETVSVFDIPESEIGARVEQLIMEFPVKECPHGEVSINNFKIRVAADSARGAANVNFGDAWLYRGNSTYDAAIYVTKDLNDMYAIVKHPGFEKYGFRVAPDKE